MYAVCDLLYPEDPVSQHPCRASVNPSLDLQSLLDIRLDLICDLQLDRVALTLGRLEREEGVPGHVDGVDSENAEVRGD